MSNGDDMEIAAIIIKWVAIYLVGVLLSMQPFYIQSGFHDMLKEDKVFRYWFYSCFILPYFWFVLFWPIAIIICIIAMFIAFGVSLWTDVIKKYIK